MTRNTLAERLAQIPTDGRHISYWLVGASWYAGWTVERGIPREMYLGKDPTGQIEARYQRQQERKEQPHGRPCGHEKPDLTCLDCIEYARHWRERRSA